MQNYDKDSPPGNPLSTELQVQLALKEFSEIDTLTQKLTMSSWFRHYWQDPRLAWDPQQWSGISSVTFIGTGDERKLWSPDAVIYEALETTMPTGDLEFTVDPAGKVTASFPFVHTIHCAMNLEDFPFDKQACKFDFGSWSYSGFILNLTARGAGAVSDGDVSSGNPVDLSTFNQPKDFALSRVEVRREVTYYNCCPDPYPVLQFTLHIQRQPLMYFCGIVLPMVIVTAIGFLGFMLNPASGERIGLAITVVLTTVAVYLVAEESIPPIDTYTVVTHLYLMSLSISGFTLVTSIFVVSLYNAKNNEGLASESELLSVFVNADEDGSGVLETSELQTVLRGTGLKDEQMMRIFEMIERKRNKRISFPEWYDIVAKVYETDGLASIHCCMYEILLRPFMRIERRLRRQVIIRRAFTSPKLQRQLDGISGSSVNLDSVAPSCPDAASIGAKCYENGSAEAGDSSSPSRPRVRPPGFVADDIANENQPDQVDPDHGLSRITADVAKQAGKHLRHVTDYAMSSSSRVAEVAINKAKSTIGVQDDEDIDIDGAESQALLTRGRRSMLITPREIADPTEIVAKRVAGLIDQTMSILTPIVYLVIVLHAVGGYHVWGVPKPVESSDCLGCAKDDPLCLRCTFVNEGG